MSRHSSATDRRLATLSRHLSSSRVGGDGGDEDGEGARDVSPAATAAAAAAGPSSTNAMSGPMFYPSVTDTMARTMQFLSFLPYPDEDRRIGEALVTQLPCPMNDPALCAQFPDFDERMHRCIVNGGRFGVGTHNIYETELSKYLAGGWGRNYLMPGILPRRDDVPYAVDAPHRRRLLGV